MVSFSETWNDLFRRKEFLVGRRGTPLFAVGAALLIVLTGMGLMFPVNTTVTLDSGQSPSFETTSLVRIEDNDLRSITNLASDQQYEMYAEIFTYAPPTSHYRVSTSFEDNSGRDHRSKLHLHRWACPICDASKTSFSVPDTNPETVAANNLKSHIRAIGGNGHGPEGTLPDQITGAVLYNHVTVIELSN